MLEASQWNLNAFATLTYADPAPLSLSREHLQLFMKRLRSRWQGHVRFYAVGEYSPSGRPHFHLALFNFPTCQYFGLKRGDCPCRPCSVVRGSWTFGHIMLGSLEPSSASYIAGYVLKKMNSQRRELLPGQIPEFALMSLRPGIGAGAMWDVASVLMQYPSRRLVDVPTTLRHGIRRLPLGPYLRRKLRERIGREALSRVKDESVRPLFEYAKANAPPSVRRELVKALVGEFNEQLNRNIKAKNVRKGSLQ
jgi:hypothetical protein